MNLHSAGATVRHSSAFDHLKSYKNNFQLSKEFIDQWVLPFYMEIRHTSGSWIENIKELKDEITEEVTAALLGDFNWRTRTVGAYLSAVKNYKHQIDIIGVHFLKSEVCYAGDLYALVFAFYNNDKTINYLNQYLDYYLQKPQLYFDQESVMETLVYLDSINETNNFEKHAFQWEKMLEKERKFLKSTIFKRQKLLNNWKEGLKQRNF
ncbi:DUF6000 family protein [Chryseobacterium kwangjuense]|uniref:DUF6000 family protein n=1 Tax=Chryseobacterium kwangjuense TaxID=267125 RepID=A0ABW9K4G8_9FLAO